MQPIPDQPALLHRGLLVVADLHLGFELELAASGIKIPSQTPEKLERLLRLVEQTKAKRLLVIGDLKHAIPISPSKEQIEIGDFIDRLRRKVHVEIVRGNHDVGIDYLGIPIYPSSGVIINRIGYFHGHSWPSPELLDCKYIVMGHTHPVVVLEDKLGYRARLPCWLRARFDPRETAKKFGKRTDAELVVMPAFNELAGGISVNTEKLLGPIFNIVEVGGAGVYLLDGTHLGRVTDLKLEGKK